MPRPKRSRVPATRPNKVASPAPEGSQSSGTPPIVTKPIGAQTEVPSSDIYGVSDREKERMKERSAGAATTGSQSRRTRASQHPEVNSEQAKVLEDSKRRRDDAMNRLDDLTSTSRPDEAESPGTRLGGETAGERQPRLTNLSGLDLDDELFANLDDSLDDTENAIEETRTGYRSTDTSSFNVAMFKRRPRQSSVAGRDDAPIRPSSRGQATPSISRALNFGNFKRRAREPSILGTGRKARTARSLSRASQASRNASVLGDGDDSGPDGESTPLDKTRRQTRASLADSPSRAGSPVLPSRKRKSLETHENNREKRPAVEPETEEPEAKELEAEEIHQSIEIEVERTPSPPRGRGRERERFSTPAHEEDDPDMAPPMSSSSESNSPAAWPSLDTLAHRTYTRKQPTRALKTPEPLDSSSDLSSPPSLTHSPNYDAPAKAVPKKKAAPPQKKVTTADLTSLLPRRRHKASDRDKDNNDPFDLDASEDERYNAADTSDVDSRPARRRKAQRPLGKSTSNSKGKQAEATNAASKRRAVRTYGSMNDDKENDEVAEEIVVASGDEELGEEEQQELPVEETSQMMVERLGEELQKAAKKFKEVDKWELSFEQATQSSSPGPFAR